MKLSKEQETIVLDELGRIVGSIPFAGSKSNQRFLDYSVRQTLAGGLGLKEYTVGVEVLGKPEGWQPFLDPTVRVRAKKLRAALADYAATEGMDAAVKITMPLGGYKCEFDFGHGVGSITSGRKPPGIGGGRRFAQAEIIEKGGHILIVIKKDDTVKEIA